MIKSFNSDPFKVIFRIYTSCQKHCVIAESHCYVYCHSQYFNISILDIYIYVSSSKNGTEIKFINLNSLKSCRLLSANERYRPVLSRSIFQDDFHSVLSLKWN